MWIKLLFLSLSLTASHSALAAFPPATDRIADCENRWFLGQNAKDADVRVLGFAYIDPEEGFTFEAHGDVALDTKGELLRKPDQLEDKARLIVRVGENVSVACLDAATVTRLGLPEQPEFLKFYQDKRSPGEHAVSWASHLNQIGASENALKQLQAAQDSGYKSSRMWLELGFAYNALGKFDKAAEVLTPAVATDPDNKLLIAELAFTYMHQGSFERAIELYTRVLSLFKGGETGLRAEYAYNLSRLYQATGDKNASDEWFKKAKQWHEQDQPHNDNGSH
jgi:tetratricopeptide (TPR) repeat protein